MIYFILKSYFTILFSIGISSVFIFIIGLYMICRFLTAVPAEAAEKGGEENIAAIAGDDVMTTQLDLARAYIETGEKQRAKKILDYIVEQGSDGHQEEARRLLNYM